MSLFNLHNISYFSVLRKTILCRHWISPLVSPATSKGQLCIRNNFQNGLILDRFNHAKSNTYSAAPDGIYVQVLPVVLPARLTGNPSASIKSFPSLTSKCKILLCKWNSGDFKDRYTGLIKPLKSREYNTVLQHHANKRFKEKHNVLLEAAMALMPSPLQKRLEDIALVGLLRFQDPPVYDEYIYLANLSVSSNNDGNDSDERMEFFRKGIEFGDNPCHWFGWDGIPFKAMPADDELWYPKVLQQQQKIKGSFTFGAWTEKTIKSFELQTVEQIK